MKVALKGYVTVAELAKQTGKHRVFISMLCRDGKIPCSRLGRMYVIPRSVARAFIRKVEAERDLRRVVEQFYTVADDRWRRLEKEAQDEQSGV